MAFLAAMLLFTLSCGDEEETATTDEATGDTTAVTPAPAPDATTASAPSTIMVVRHKVKDYAKWKESYDAHDSLRLANGMHSFIIGRGIDDPNILLVAVKADDVEKAKAFSKSPDLKKAMEKSGVTGTPKIMITTVPFLNTAATSDLRSASFFTVKDWDTWKASFEKNKASRLENGLEDRGYGHDVDDNHKILYVASVVDSVKARTYQKSALLKQRLDSSGVVGAPERFWYRVVQTY